MDLSSEVGQIVTLVKQTYAAGFATTSRKAAIAKHKEWDCASIGCNYQGGYGNVHPEVCGWHRKEQDPWCLNHCGEKNTLVPGEYKPDFKGGWRLVKRYRDP